MDMKTLQYDRSYTHGHAGNGKYEIFTSETRIYSIFNSTHVQMKSQQLTRDDYTAVSVSGSEDIAYYERVFSAPEHWDKLFICTPVHEARL